MGGLEKKMVGLNTPAGTSNTTKVILNHGSSHLLILQ